MDAASLIIQLLGGSIGGCYAASKVQQASLGSAGNWLIGTMGGLFGGNLVGNAMEIAKHAGSGGLDLGSVVGLLAGSSLSGGLVTLAVGWLRQRFTN